MSSICLSELWSSSLLPLLSESLQREHTAGGSNVLCIHMFTSLVSIPAVSLWCFSRILIREMFPDHIFNYSNCNVSLWPLNHDK